MFSISSLSKAFNNFTHAPVNVRTLTQFHSPLFVKLTHQLYAEPLKKKRKIDPAILKQREEKKKRRLEKQIRRLEKGVKQLKPIDECEIPMEIINDRTRVRKVTVPLEVTNQRMSLFKSWSAHKNNQNLIDVQMIDRILFSHQRALDELKLESKSLYDAALQTDDFLQLCCKGPVETPPIETYDSPDGEYSDISKKWN